MRLSSGLFVLFLAALPARAEEPASQGLTERIEAPARNWVNFRVGGSTQSLYPQMCLEVTPLEVIGTEACGNGSGFLHQENAPEIAHFRAKVRGPAYKNEWLWLEPWAGLGFAELQLGEDAPGFYFLDAGPFGVETAGPEVTGALRALMPIGWGFELVGEVSVGAAYFESAPELVRPQSPWQLSVGFTVGAGF